VLLACCNEHSLRWAQGSHKAEALRAVILGEKAEQKHEANPVPDQGRAQHYIAPQHCTGKKGIRVPSMGDPSQQPLVPWSFLGSKALN